jgi:small-conductance mechanosensitive channel
MNALIQAVATRLQMSGERLVVASIGYLGVALLAAFSLAAFAYAAAVALSEIYGPVVAALVLGAVSAVLAVLTLLVINSRRRRRHMRASAMVPPRPMAGLATTLLPDMVRASPIGTLVAVAAAAYVLQRSSQDRRPRRDR